MDNNLRELTHVERELVFKAPLMVCILIAGADGRVDDTEIKKALEISRHQHWVKANLQKFFRELATDFEDKMKIVLQSYPRCVEERNAVIETELKELNAILHRLETTFASSYYEMLKYLAKEIAASSGGFWGGKITEEEARLLDLPMLDDPSKKST